MADKGEQILELQRRLSDVEPLPEEPDFFLSHETLTRYLKARQWKMVESEKMIRASIEWRRIYKPLSVDCGWCHSKPGFHSMRQVGYDEMGRPVIYSCFAQAAVHKAGVEDSVAHVTYLIENAKVTMPPGVHTWVFIIDCTGMTVPSCNPKLGYGVTQVMSNHYPERLGLVICLNHNRVFQGIWSTIRSFLHPNTVAKVQLVRSKKKIAEAFNKFFSEELTSWLLEEIKLNKQSRLPQSQREFWKAPADPSAHDPRGCPSYVERHLLAKVNGGVVDHKPGPRHKPHPNIVDALLGNVRDADSDMEEERLTELKSVGANCDESSASDDDASSIKELSISEEFQIPKEAAKLGN